MYQRIGHIALVVADYDEAIAYYTEKLDFVLLEDTPLADDKRWVVVSPTGAMECSLLLAKAANPAQAAAIGNQTGGRVSMFLYTDDFWRDYNRFVDREVTFVRPPAEYQYGTVAVFTDLYGNMWDLVQPSVSNKGWIQSTITTHTH